MRPVVGITTYVEQARWGVWDAEVALLPARYVRHVAAAGGLPVLLPPPAAAPGVGDAATLVDRLDALVLAGGADIEPARYGAPPHPLTTGTRPDRDAAELALVRAALALDLPVLGICRGMQLLAVAHGGALHQHLPEVVGHEGHRPAPGAYAEHGVRLAADSHAGRLLGEQAVVRSYHHQGVADPGTLTPTGWAEDGSVEALERPDRRFLLGVLWHPEAGEDGRLFEGLVAAARVPA